MMHNFWVLQTPHPFTSIQARGSCNEQPISVFSSTEDKELGGQEFNEIFPADDEEWTKECPEGKTVAAAEWEKSANEILHNAIKRLGLHFLSGENELDALPCEKLSYEKITRLKMNLKRELKYFDTTFKGHFGSLPTHRDKEVMRPLYAYYRKLRDIMATKRTSNNPIPPGRDSRTLSANEDSEEPKKGKPDERSLQIMHQLPKLVEKKLVLKTKLQEYQATFQREKGTRIKYLRDIAPIEPIYNQYKEIKEQMARLQEELKTMERESEK